MTYKGVIIEESLQKKKLGKSYMPTKSQFQRAIIYLYDNIDNPYLSIAKNFSKI